MRVKMLRTVQGSPDGIRSFTYREGEVYDLGTNPQVNDRLGTILVRGQLAEEVREEQVAPGDYETKVVDPAPEKASESEEDEASSEDEEGASTDLSEMTVSEVLSAVREREVSASQAMAHERNGKRRSTLINQLSELMAEGG